MAKKVAPGKIGKISPRSSFMEIFLIIAFVGALLYTMWINQAMSNSPITVMHKASSGPNTKSVSQISEKRDLENRIEALTQQLTHLHGTLADLEQESQAAPEQEDVAEGKPEDKVDEDVPLFSYLAKAAPIKLNKPLFPDPTAKLGPFGRPRVAIFMPINMPKDSLRVEAIEAGWGKHADRVWFVIAENVYEKLAENKKDNSWRFNKHGEERFLPVPMSHSDEFGLRNIWEKCYHAWVYIAANYIDDFDWFMKTDSDSFVGVENLKTYLSYFDPKKEFYMGHTLLHRWASDNIVFNAGPGYVQSQASLRRVYEEKLKKIPDCTGMAAHGCCLNAGAGEDPHMGTCLRDIGIRPVDTITKTGKIRFMTFRPEDHMKIPKEPTWYWDSMPDHMKPEKECCSRFVVVAHNYKDADPRPIQAEMEKRYHDDLMGTGRIDEEPVQTTFKYKINFHVDDKLNTCSPPSKTCVLGGPISQPV